MAIKSINNFLLLTLLFLYLSFAQENQINFQEIANSIVGILVIVIIVLILLYLGGIWKPGRARIPWQFIIYLILIIVIFILPILQKVGVIHIFPDKITSEQLKNWGFPQNENNRLPSLACKVFTIINLQEEVACYLPEVIFLFILPFVAIFAITWGFLTQLRIFEGNPKEANLYALLAFIISFMTIPMGTFIILVAFWFSFMGAFSVAVFVAMFVAGVFFRGYEFTAGGYYKARVKVYESAKQSQKISIANDLARLRARLTGAMTYNDVLNEIDLLIRGYPTFAPELSQLKSRINQLAGNNPNAQISNNLENIQKEIDNLVQQLR